MLIRIFSLTFDSALGGFNDEPLREFLKDKEIISTSDHFFTRNEVPYLTLIIKYFPTRPEIDPKMEPKAKREEAWRDSLTEADMGLFNMLRDWRSERCKRDGVPPYILFNNQQLAQLVKLRPQSLADLMKIEGVGSIKAQKYGEDLLKITKLPAAVPAEVQEVASNE